MKTQEEVNKFVSEIENMKINSEEDAVNVSRAIVKLYNEAGDFIIDDEKIEKIEAIVASKIRSPESAFVNILYPDRIKVHNESEKKLALLENAVLETGVQKEDFFTWIELENAEERYFNTTCIMFGQNTVNEFEIKDERLKKEYENWMKDIPQKDIDYINRSPGRTKVLIELYDDLLTLHEISKKINIHPHDLYQIMNNLEEKEYIKSINYHAEKIYKIELKGLKIIHQMKVNNQINNN